MKVTIFKYVHFSSISTFTLFHNFPISFEKISMVKRDFAFLNTKKSFTLRKLTVTQYKYNTRQTLSC